VVEVTKENFRDVVAAGIVLVDVWGPGCAPCVAMMPRVEELATRLNDGQGGTRVAVVRLDSSKNRRLCIEHRILGLPAFLLFHEGKEVGRIGGNDVTFEEMKAWLEGQLTKLSA
jgi:thioredoxin 1